THNGCSKRLKAERCTRPFDQQTFVFHSNGAFAAMTTNRGETQQRIEVITTERAKVRSNPKIALLQRRLHHNRKKKRSACRERRRNQRGTIQPDDAGCGKKQLEGISSELNGHLRQTTHSKDRMAALRHV